jgi:hypothetical protein
MKIPFLPIVTTFELNMTHGYSERLGSVNVSLSLPLDRQKYLAGLSTIDCIDENVLPNLIIVIPNYIEDI